jgi:glycosyltransferase involved in cell wall biosynthesis
MHIAIDVRALMEGRHSGVETYTTHIITSMARVAPSHTYHLFYNSARPVHLPIFPRNVVTHAFRYPNKVFNGVQWAADLPRWDVLVPADAYFVPSPRLVPLSLSAPLVAVAHDLSFERFPEFLNLRRRAWHRLMRVRQLMEKSDHIIAVSEHTKQDLISLYAVPEENITVIYPGITAGIGHIRPTQIRHVRRLYNLPERFVLSFGALEPRKNVTGIVRAFSAIADTIDHHLVIAGESGWKQRELYRVIDASPVRDRIVLAGFIREEHKAALYAAADVFVYPSFYEGFGFPPLESLVAGTPVVTSFNSALPEVVGRWATLVDPYNTAELAAVLREMLASPLRVPAADRRAVQETYSWDGAARQVLDTIVRCAQ